MTAGPAKGRNPRNPRRSPCNASCPARIVRAVIPLGKPVEGGPGSWMTASLIRELCPFLSRSRALSQPRPYFAPCATECSQGYTLWQGVDGAVASGPCHADDGRRPESEGWKNKVSPRM